MIATPKPVSHSFGDNQIQTGLVESTQRRRDFAAASEGPVCG
jgi:hypothetical protein